MFCFFTATAAFVERIEMLLVVIARKTGCTGTDTGTDTGTGSDTGTTTDTCTDTGTGIDTTVLLALVLI